MMAKRKGTRTTAQVREDEIRQTQRVHHKAPVRHRDRLSREYDSEERWDRPIDGRPRELDFDK